MGFNSGFKGLKYESPAHKAEAQRLSDNRQMQYSPIHSHSTRVTLTHQFPSVSTRI